MEDKLAEQSVNPDKYYVCCPQCKSKLSVPIDYTGRRVKCGKCQNRFELPPPPDITEQSILDWLGEEEEDPGESENLKTRRPDLTVHPGAISSFKPKAPLKPAASAPQADAQKVFLIRADAGGALFEFPLERMNDPRFRSLIPRRCMKCGIKVKLTPHLIPFFPGLKTVMAPDAELRAADLPFDLGIEDADHLPISEVIARLPDMPEIPAPASLPMPYWMCESCTKGELLVQGRCQMPAENQPGLCRLLIKNIARAEEFLIAAGGANTRDHEKLLQYIGQSPEHMWNMLDKSVQHRITQWFHQQKGENFLAYLPDRDLSKHEDGMCGIIVTNRRLVFNSKLMHFEGPPSLKMTITVSDERERKNIQIRTAEWYFTHFTSDTEGVQRLKTTLSKAGFNTEWRIL